MEYGLRGFIPPVIWKIFTQARGRYGYFGNFAAWEEAEKASTGYDSDRILEKVKDSLLKVRNGEAACERDSVLFDKIQYSWPLLACLLWISSRKGNKLNLVDFGGSLGSTYFQTRTFLLHLEELRWNIVEQNKFVECGKNHFEDVHLKFYHDLVDCHREHRPDAILFSSSLQYLEKPYDILKKVLTLGFDFLIFDRTPFLEDGDDRITVQRVPPLIYKASYPAWFFNEKKFLRFFSETHERIADFESGDKANIASVFKGFLFAVKHKTI